MTAADALRLGGAVVVTTAVGVVLGLGSEAGVFPAELIQAQLGAARPVLHKLYKPVRERVGEGNTLCYEELPVLEYTAQPSSVVHATRPFPSAPSFYPPPLGRFCTDEMRLVLHLGGERDELPLEAGGVRAEEVLLREVLLEASVVRIIHVADLHVEGERGWEGRGGGGEWDPSER